MLATLQDSHKHTSTWQIPGILDAATCAAWAHANKEPHGSRTHFIWVMARVCMRRGSQPAVGEAPMRPLTRVVVCGIGAIWAMGHVEAPPVRDQHRVPAGDGGAHRVCSWGARHRCALGHLAGRLRITLQGGWGSPYRAAEDHPAGRLRITLQGGWRSPWDEHRHKLGIPRPKASCNDVQASGQQRAAWDHGSGWDNGADWDHGTGWDQWYRLQS